MKMQRWGQRYMYIQGSPILICVLKKLVEKYNVVLVRFLQVMCVFGTTEYLLVLFECTLVVVCWLLFFSCTS